MALEFLKVDDETAKRARVSVQRPADGATALVTVTVPGQVEESVDAVRQLVTMTRVAARWWRVDTSRLTWRCARGRGHRTFSAASCAESR